MESNIFDIQNILNELAKSEYTNKYFYKGREREKFQTKMWVRRDENWIQLNEDEKKQAGRERALQHNKNAKRKIHLLKI